MTRAERELAERRLKRCVDAFGECLSIARSGWYPDEYRAEAARIKRDSIEPLFEALESDYQERRAGGQTA